MKKPTKAKKTTKVKNSKKVDDKIDKAIIALKHTDRDMEIITKFATVCLGGIMSSAETLAALGKRAEQLNRSKELPYDIADAAWGQAVAMFVRGKIVGESILAHYLEGKPLPGEVESNNIPFANNGDNAIINGRN